MRPGPLRPRAFLVGLVTEGDPMGGLGSGSTPDAKRRRRQAAVARSETAWEALEQAGLTLPAKKRGRKERSSVETGEGRKGQGK